MNEEDNNLSVQTGRERREDWEQAFIEMSKRGDDTLLDESVPSRWDELEWTW